MPDSPEHRAEMFQLASQRKAQGKPVWAYKLSADVRAELSFEQARDNFAAALKASSWFRAKAGSEEDPEELWELWDEIKDAEDVDHFDVVLNAIYDLADYDRCWIEMKH